VLVICLSTDQIANWREENAANVPDWKAKYQKLVMELKEKAGAAPADAVGELASLKAELTKWRKYGWWAAKYMKEGKPEKGAVAAAEKAISSADKAKAKARAVRKEEHRATEKREINKLAKEVKKSEGDKKKTKTGAGIKKALDKATKVAEGKKGGAKVPASLKGKVKAEAKKLKDMKLRKRLRVSRSR
jgi:hypothetical protein